MRVRSVSGFDAIAEVYDSTFTHTRIGSLMRAAVQSRMDVHFRPGQHILELNCGTGEDAIHLGKRGVEVLATDASLEMIRLTSAKIMSEKLSRIIKAQRLDWEAPSTLPVAEFDGALSNFGGLNCVEDLRGAAQALAGCIRIGGIAVLVIMGPLCPWEWIWFMLHGRLSKAFRRLRTGVQWRGTPIRYPSIGTTKRAFSPMFRMIRASALGALLPPPFAESLAMRYPKMAQRLNRWEREIESLPLLPSLADHYVVELERQ
jgi:SAM-dependent methyltransferase